MASFLIETGTTDTDRITMAGEDDLTVQVGAALSVSANQQAVRFVEPTDGAVIENLGTIEATAEDARAIRFEDTIGDTLDATIENGGIIQSDNDAVQIQGGVTSGTFTIVNAVGGTITSETGQALDLAGGSGAFVVELTNAGDIFGLNNDGVRIGGVGNIANTGLIDGGSGDGYAVDEDGSTKADGVQYEDDATGTLTNEGDIAGDRHGVNAGAGSVVAVINEEGATITGRNGSGFGSDGSGSVVNRGTITGGFSDSEGSDVNGSTPGEEDGGGPDGIRDGDGDGVDIDGQADIENFGLIEGTGAGGTGSDGLPNTAEGIAAGGGEITNHLGAIIIGAGLGILIDDSSQGDAPFQTTIVNDGEISGETGAAIRIVSSLADTIANNGTIAGGADVAILFGAGDNILFVGGTSEIVGLTDGEGGTNTLDYATFGTAGVAVDLTAGTATGTGGIASFQDVVGSDGDDEITGTEGANVLQGGDGDDLLEGLGGGDDIDGGAGTDTVAYAGVRADYGHDLLEDGTITVMNPDDAGDTLVDIERLQFDDGAFIFDLGSENGAAAYRLYQSAFDRTPDEAGLRFWAGILDGFAETLGETAAQVEVAGYFVGSDEFAELFGVDPTDAEYVDALYENTLDRAPDQAGLDFWIEVLGDGTSREQMLVYFSESGENVENTAPNVDDGYWIA